MTKYDVFISYSRLDTKIVDRICAAFDAAGITYFIDRQGISAGMEFPLVIANAIKDSKLFLFVASRNAYESKFTNSEITYAFNKKEKGQIIPYIIDGSSLPEHLQFVFSSINWRYRRGNDDDARLIEDLFSVFRKPVSIPMSVSRPNKNTRPSNYIFLICAILAGLLSLWGLVAAIFGLVWGLTESENYSVENGILQCLVGMIITIVFAILSKKLYTRYKRF